MNNIIINNNDNVVFTSVEEICEKCKISIECIPRSNAAKQFILKLFNNQINVHLKNCSFFNETLINGRIMNDIWYDKYCECVVTDYVINSTVNNNLGYYYQWIKKDYKTMEKYYLASIELKNSFAMCNLGCYYTVVEKNYELMKKYFLMAIELGNSHAMYELGCYYANVEKDYELMKNYFLLAIELGNVHVMVGLGIYYRYVEKDYKLMHKYYSMAIELGHSEAMVELANYYHYFEKNYELTKKYYLMAIEFEDTCAMHNLGCYYASVEHDYVSMEKYYLMAIDCCDNEITIQNLYNYYNKHVSLLKLYILLSNLSTTNKRIKDKIIELEKEKSVFRYKNKKRLFEQLQNYKKCPVCLEENKLNVDYDCGHEICIDCFVNCDSQCYFHFCR